MQIVDYDKLLKLAETYAKENIPWHHHFLTSKCILNQDKKFQIILENEESRESFVCLFESKPMQELEQLENIFFNRNSPANIT
jgi:hypothetical protein